MEKIYPRTGDTQTVYLNAVVKDPSIEVGDFLHMVVRADIFGKTVLCEFVPGVCPVRGGLSYFQCILLVVLCEHLQEGLSFFLFA